MTHQIVVSNIGTVYTGTDQREALRHYVMYEEQAQQGYGRAAGETVTWMRDGDIYMETEC